MPETPIVPAAQSPSTEKTARIVYILYLVSLAGFGVTAIVGVVMAYIYEGEAPGWLKAHYRFQIRTFWIGLLYGVVGGILSLVFIGFAVLVFVVVWLVVRCVKGLQALEKGQPVAKVGTWLW
jgi:uncharacterized membrane protein